ncbi:hypothetical protein TrLO_g4650 [Triparma laevis f. longispina]|uniref:Ion transport domain-containing protein n=1 Tax=Triparma laevis f. longispina TaxID=1714387 RepID=A0A9W7F9I8_9STRA|nr:hypothetical protein TrLO_g4650 [Triparma laevis f. longispina]
MATPPQKPTTQKKTWKRLFSVPNLFSSSPPAANNTQPLLNPSSDHETYFIGAPNQQQQDDEDVARETEEETLERMSHQLPQLPADLFHSALRLNGQSSDSHFDTIMTYHHRMKMAADYCDDALHDRNLQVTPTHKLQKIAQKIYANIFVEAFVIITIMFQMLLAVWEDPVDSSKDDEWVSNANACCQCIYVLDVILGTIAMGRQRFFRKKWNVVRCIIICVMFVGTATDRPLRSALLISRVRVLRHTVNSMAKSVPKAVEVFVLFGVTIIFYSVLGQVLFKGEYQFESTSFDPVTNTTNRTAVTDDEFTGSFDSFSRAALAMFVLSTTENYPMIMFPSQVNYPISGTLFFISYIMIMVYIILALFQAALYKTWSEELEAQQIKIRVRKYHSLLAAYHVLLDDGNKDMSLAIWVDLVKILRPDVSPGEVKLMFMVMDETQTGSINLKQFLGGAVEALQYDFDDIRREMEINEAISKGKMFFGKKLRTKLKKIMRTRVWRSGIYFVVIAHTVTIILAPLPLEYPRDIPYEIILLFLLACSVVEMIFKLIAYPIVRYWKGFSRFDLLIISASILTEFIFPLFRVNQVGDWARATQCVRVLRLISLSRRMRQLTTTVAGVKNVIVRFFLVFSLLVYSFAAVAVLIFNGNISDDYDPNDDDGFDVLDPKAQLNTMDQCLLALFQIAVTNNWQDIMFINIVDGQTVDMWGSLFFIIYFVVVVWFGTNIMGAVVIEAYVTAVDRRDLEKKEKLKKKNNVGAGGDLRGSPTGEVVAKSVKIGIRRRKTSAGDPNSRKDSAPPVLDVPSSPQENVEREFKKRLERKNSLKILGGGLGGDTASTDLKNSEVLGMLQQEVDKTHDSVRRNSVQISERLLIGVKNGNNGSVSTLSGTASK